MNNPEITPDPCIQSGKFSTRLIFLIMCISSCLMVWTGVLAETNDGEQNPQVITFQLTDFGDDDILRVSLMKEGESSKNGMVRQVQNIQLNRETNSIEWNPCNDNACMVASLPTAGGTTGRDQLILELTFQNPAVDTSSCHGNPTCERLKGGTYTKSGMLDGMFYTGKVYAVSVQSLKAGIGEAFTITQVS